MSRKKQIDRENTPSTVADIINEIEKKTTDGDYIFRGESQGHEKVSSSLYRELESVKVKYSDIMNVQAEIVRDAKTYTDKTDDFEILTELQHYGGKTNLIDFTTDYKVALFFASSGSPDKHGRVIILQKTKAIKDMIELPRNSVKRATDQKSVFVQPPKGYIERGGYEEIFVPKELKLSMLRHLYRHKISSETIYNDIHGFISRESTFWMAYKQFNSGLTSQNKGDYEEAIAYYTKALEQGLRPPEVYNNRGNAHLRINKIDEAIGDFSQAIELKPDFAKAYNNRGNAYVDKGDFTEAIKDFTNSIQLKPDFAEAYKNRGTAYLNKGNFDLALKDFDKAVQLVPDEADFYISRGGAYSIAGDFDNAIKDLNESIKLNLNEPDAYLLRGIAYTKKREFDKAIADFNKAIELKQDYANAYFCRGIVWLHLKKWDRARGDLAAAKDKRVDIVAAFHNSYRDVAMFERRNSVKLPKDIVAMLTQYPVNSSTTTQKILTAEGKYQESPAVLDLLEKFRNAGKPLSEYLRGQPSRGITTGCNEAFIVERATRDTLIADRPSSAEVLKPFLMARDIQRWRVKPIDESRREPQDKWLIFTHRGIDIDAYPAIKKHLGKYRDALEKRAGKQEWYELQTAPTDTVRFTQPKCIYADMASETAFAFDDEGYYVGSSASLLPTSELWLLGVLNTRAVSWFYARTAPQIRGPFLKFVPRYVSQIPMPDMEAEQRALIHKIVEYILYLKKQPTVNSRDLKYARDAVMLGYFDRIIDGIVYEAYLPDELHKGRKHFFQPLLDEQLPLLEDIQSDKMSALRDIFERLYEKTHPVAVNLFFLDSVKPIRIIESKA